MRKIIAMAVAVLLAVCLGSEITAGEDKVAKQFRWNYIDSSMHSYSLSIDIEISSAYLEGYERYSILERSEYTRLITTYDPDIRAMVDDLKNITAKNNFNNYDEVNYILAFVQTLNYTSDLETTGYEEYPRFPTETLVDEGGDCEDKSVLFATLIISLGYDAVLFLLRDEEHMAVGVRWDNLIGDYITYKGARYYYAETTAPAWHLGEMPDEFSNAKIEVLEFSEEMQYTPSFSSNNAEQFGMDYTILLIAVAGIALLILFIAISRSEISMQYQVEFYPLTNPYTEEVIFPILCNYCLNPIGDNTVCPFCGAVQ